MFTLGRKIDFNYKTNKIIVIVSILVAVIGWILTKKVLSGLNIGIGVFLTWALSRELDPKHDYSAFIAAGFSFINLLYYENIQLLVIFWIILLMRIVNGITGKALTTFDIISVLGLTIYLSLNNKNSVYLIIFTLAMVFILRTIKNRNLILISGGISLVFFIVESFLMKYLSFNNTNYSSLITIFTILILCISFILFWFLSKEEIKDDIGNIVKRSKILGSQILFSMVVLLLFFFGDININNLIIYLSVILGITIYFVIFKVLNMNRYN